MSAYFSTNYLGMHKSYYGMLQASEKEPSTTALVNLHEAILICSGRINGLLDNKLSDLASKILYDISTRGRNNISKNNNILH